MSTTLHLPDNPYVSLKDDMVYINCGHKRMSLAVADIRKICLHKYCGYWHEFIGKWLSIPNNLYDLHVETKDGRVIKFTINSLERFYCIRLIYLIRHWGSRKKSRPASPANYFTLATA